MKDLPEGTIGNNSLPQILLRCAHFVGCFPCKWCSTDWQTGPRPWAMGNNWRARLTTHFRLIPCADVSLRTWDPVEKYPNDHFMMNTETLEEVAMLSIYPAQSKECQAFSDISLSLWVSRSPFMCWHASCREDTSVCYIISQMLVWVSEGPLDQSTEN